MHTGENLIVVGLFLQLAFFGFFIIVAGLFHYRLVNDRPTKQISLNCFRRGRSRRLTDSSAAPITSSPVITVNDLPWKRHIYALYAGSVLILIRSLFRVIEYLQGNDGYLLKHEVFLYVFDATLMLFVMILFNWVHPSEVTEALQRRKAGRSGTPDVELQSATPQYLEQETKHANEEQERRPWV
jgi:hypothetical protein